MCNVLTYFRNVVNVALFQVLYELILGIFTLTGEFLCQKKKKRDRRKLTMMYAFCKDSARREHLQNMHKVAVTFRTKRRDEKDANS